MRGMGSSPGKSAGRYGGNLGQRLVQTSARALRTQRRRQSTGPALPPGPRRALGQRLLTYPFQVGNVHRTLGPEPRLPGSWPDPELSPSFQGASSLLT